MEIKRLISKYLQTNTYIVIAGKTAIVIDPGAEAEKITAAARESGAEIAAILLTHGHFDHATYAAELKAATGAKIHIHAGDAPMLGDPELSSGKLFPKLFKPCEPDVLIADGQKLTFGELRLKVTATPGHTQGSVLFIVDDIIFSGDTLFEGSVGRTDLCGSSPAQMQETLVKIAALEGDFRVLPGHGNETTLERERQTNPYLL